jgi:hypothetical protein
MLEGKMKNHHYTSRTDSLFLGPDPKNPGRFCTTCDLSIEDPIHNMPRQCFRCSNPATNLETAQMGICDECFDSLVANINKAVHEASFQEPILVDYRTYKKIKEEK